MNRIIKYCFILWLVLFLNSCVWFAEHYTGFNMQPDINPQQFEQGLNVFGVIRAGEHLDTLNHWFEVQIMANLAGETDTLFVENAIIELTRWLPSQAPITYELQHWCHGIYLGRQIKGLPGEHWDFFCTYDTFRVSSSCTVPNLPKMVINSLELKNKHLSFSVEYDSSAFVYDIFLFDGKQMVFDRIEAVTDQNLKVELDIPLEMNQEQVLLYAYAYDSNFARYFSASATFFKPNAYRPPFTAVSGGYGVFGAVSGARLWPVD